MTWVDQSSLYGFGTVLTSTSIQNMRDNFTGLANGDTGAPKIQQPAMTDVPVGRMLLGTIDLSLVTSAYIPFINKFTSSYDNYVVEFTGVQVESCFSNGRMAFQVSPDGGSTWVSGVYGVNRTELSGGAVSSAVSLAQSAGYAVPLSTGYNVDSLASASGRLNIHNPLSVTEKIFDGFGTYKTSGYPYQVITGNVWASDSGFNSIRFSHNQDISSLYFRSGKVCLYGLLTNSF